MAQAGKIDHYAVLGVSPEASPEDIKAAYKAAILQHHPDKQSQVPSCQSESPGGGNDQFAAVQTAWEVLRSPDSRRQYDQQLSLQQTEANTPISEEVDLTDMDSFLEDGVYWYSHPCRCGSAFEVPDSELDEGANSIVIGCGSCSLYVRVLYRAVG